MGVHLHRLLTIIITVFIILAQIPEPAVFDAIEQDEVISSGLFSDLVPETLTAYASVPDTDLGNACGNTGDLLAELAGSSGWGKDAGWIVLAQGRAGLLTEEQAAAYYSSILTALDSAGSAQLSQSQSTENSKAILTLTAAGYDASDVGGYDLLEPLAHMNFVSGQGLNGVIWALLAIDCKGIGSDGYEIPECADAGARNSREALVSRLLTAQHSDGGWAYGNYASDTDMTSMAIQALAPYYRADAEIAAGGETVNVRRAVEKGLDWLSSAQNADGSFSSGGNVNAESASQVIVALTSLGIDPALDARFLKGENADEGALDSLMSFYGYGGGFKHVSSNYKYNGLASMQAYYALVSYYRFRDGRNALYDMTDSGSAYVIELSYERETGAAADDEDGENTGDNSGSEDAGSGDGSADNDGQAGAALGKTRSLGLLKLKPAETAKTKAAGKLIEVVANMGLSDDASSYSAADIEAIEAAYKAYDALSRAEQLAAEKSGCWEAYCSITSALGKYRHYDEASGVDMRVNSENALPWYIMLNVREQAVDADTEQKILDTLGDGSRLPEAYDITLINSLTGDEWYPESPVTVRMPVPDELEGNPLIIHISDEGRIEIIEGTTTEQSSAGDEGTGGASLVEFRSADFSVFGIAESASSIREMMKTQEQSEIPETDTKTQSSGNGILLWLLTGGAALTVLIILMIFRRRFTRQES